MLSRRLTREVKVHWLLAQKRFPSFAVRKLLKDRCQSKGPSPVNLRAFGSKSSMVGGPAEND